MSLTPEPMAYPWCAMYFAWKEWKMGGLTPEREAEIRRVHASGPCSLEQGKQLKDLLAEINRLRAQLEHQGALALAVSERADRLEQAIRKALNVDGLTPYIRHQRARDILRAAVEKENPVEPPADPHGGYVGDP